MMRRNNTPQVDRLPLATFDYPSHDEITAMVRQAQRMRAEAMRDSVRRLWALVTRRRPSATVGQSAALKA